MFKEIIKYCFSRTTISFSNFFAFKLIQIITLSILIANISGGGKESTFLFLLFLVVNIPLSILIFLITKYVVRIRIIGFLIFESLSYFIIVLPIDKGILISNETNAYLISVLVGFIFIMIMNLLMKEEN